VFSRIARRNIRLYRTFHGVALESPYLGFVPQMRLPVRSINCG
jgi:hypothetical protein